MDRDSVILGALAEKAIEVDAETGFIYSRRIKGKIGQRVRLQGANCNGYIVHNLSYKGIKRQTRAHRIVWMSANGPIPEDLMIDHINRDKTDNRLVNLRLVNAKGNAENTQKLYGENSPVAKLKQEQVTKIHLLHQQGLEIREIAQEIGISKSQVHNILSGKSWSEFRFQQSAIWLHNHQWPARPGEEQKAGEPSRTITEKIPFRNQRLKALGNAIVPQQIYPLFNTIVGIEQIMEDGVA